MTRQARRGRPWLVLALVLFGASVALHLPVTDYLDELAKRHGFPAYDRAMRSAFVVLGATGFVSLWRGRSHPRVVRTCLLLFGGFSLIASRWLLVTAVENVHYPQYVAITGCLLLARVGGEAAWLSGVGLGVADELFQYLWLPRGRPDYLDFNDIVLNAGGAAMALVIALGLKPALLAGERLAPGRVFGALSAALVSVALLVEPPGSSPFFQTTPGGRTFHALAAWEAALTLALLWWAVRGLVRVATGAQSAGAVPAADVVAPPPGDG